MGNNGDVKAVNYIYSVISNRQLELVSEQETAHEVIKKLDELYLKESTALQIICRSNLETLKQKESSEPTTFFNEFEKA